LKLLLDTHTLLWFALGDERCSDKARQLIEDPINEKWVSPASLWELAIKISLGRYSLPGHFEDFAHAAIEGNGFSTLPILPKHTGSLIHLPFHHRDPFDRLVIAQAMTELMSLVSADEVFDAYPIQRLW
jgi:PIN domain nuclease of toxin-antitoxin system